MKGLLVNVLGIFILCMPFFLFGIFAEKLSSVKTVDNETKDSFEDKQATAEQLVILHYIKHHIGTKENEMMFEHSDGIITEKDYHEVLERVHKKFNIDGFNETYTRQ